MGEHSVYMFTEKSECGHDLLMQNTREIIVDQNELGQKYEFFWLLITSLNEPDN